MYAAVHQYYAVGEGLSPSRDSTSNLLCCKSHPYRYLIDHLLQNLLGFGAGKYSITQRIVLSGDVWKSLCFIVAYTKDRYENSNDTRELLDLAIILLGYLCYDSP